MRRDWDCDHDALHALAMGAAWVLYGVALAVICLLVAIAAFVAADANAYPETVRHGYTGTCAACHVQPTGGGVLTAYGQMESAATLSTFQAPYTEKPAAAQAVDFGADFRELNLNVTSPAGKLHRKIPMQLEAELAVSPLAGVTIDASIGTYGPEQRQEFRRYYLMLQPAPWAYVRAGRFLPAFGVLGVDHTAWVRDGAGYGEGAERFGVEVGAMTRYFQVVVGQQVGERFTLAAAADELRLSDNAEETTARIEAYPLPRLVTGISSAWDRGVLRATGAHALYAPLPWLVLAAEGVRVGQDRGLLTDARLSLEPYRGLLPYVGHEYAAKTASQRYRAGLQWMVTRGLELEGRWRRTREKDGSVADELTALLHAYL